MNSRDKLIDIMERFGLDEDHMREITHSTSKRIKKLISGESELNETEISHICKTFNIKPKIFHNQYPLPMLTMTKEIDMKAYKTILNAYVEILKEYYKEPWEVFVLAKIPYRNAFQSFIDAIFQSESSIQENMGTFTPNYLAIKEEKYLLVNIRDGILEVSELDDSAKEHRFIYKKFKYVRANKVQLKKYVPAVERYFQNF